MSEAAVPPLPLKKPARVVRALRALRDRRMAAMALFAFAAGLPMGVTLGLLNAWLTKLGITPSTIGTLSLLTLGYSFKYLWAPVFQTARPAPLTGFLGGRRSWLLLFQGIMVVLIGIFAFTNPAENIGLVALIALAIALVSPTHDIVLDAWRIEVARSDEDKDLMSALYQFGYKSAGFISGFIALLVAARAGWTATFLMVAFVLALSMIGSIIAPEPASSKTPNADRLSFLSSLPRRVSTPAVTVVAIGWLIGFAMILVFVMQSLFSATPPSGGTFVRSEGPWIVGLTVLVPAIVSAILVFRFGAKAAETPARIANETRAQSVLRNLFRAIFDPLMELISRLKWGAVLVLLLALTYRFTDAVWGAFAYPFYLGDQFGALGHSLDDIAIASKFFGVVATILGSLLGAVLIAVLGRMPVFFVGGIVAAATNLLYADLAAGATVLDGFLHISHLGPPLSALADWAAKLSPDVVAADQGQRMARLMVTIFAENIAGGFALVAITAYLTSVVNPRFAAVQYALLASLTMLIGTLGRPWLGEIIESQGYYSVFMITFWLGGVAVILSVLEWMRQARDTSGSTSLVLAQDD
ncbi:beta-lactamase induction signal transducer [Hyphomonas sp.]|jgi:PAT family beta-lactamase induction signal transducer AmpG|uniref:beta-lactamase induction signal transducer n=1 Tax=Hyphomonas sp. TaxID=87 RepID=UPI0039E57658